MEVQSDLHGKPEAASEMAANSVLSYLHQCGVQGRKEKEAWIKNVFDKVTAKELAQ